MWTGTIDFHPDNKAEVEGAGVKLLGEVHPQMRSAEGWRTYHCELPDERMEDLICGACVSGAFRTARKVTS